MCLAWYNRRISTLDNDLLAAAAAVLLQMGYWWDMENISDCLIVDFREKQGKKAQPTVAIIDSQSSKIVVRALRMGELMV